MNKFSSQNNKDWNENLNNSIFEKEGEYIINKKPKYKYDIKIVHENPNLTFSRRAKTPDKFISSSNSAILNNTKRAHCIKQNNNDSTIVFYSNNSPLRSYNLNNRYFQNKNYYCKCNPENTYHKGNCICQNEFNKFLRNYDGEYFYKYNYNYNNNCYKFENILKTNNEYNSGLNNCYKRKKIYIGNVGKKKLNQNYCFHSPLKVNKISHSNIYNKAIENNNNYYLLNQNSSNKKKKKIKKYTNKEIKIQSKDIEEKNHFSNYSFLAIDNSKNKNNSPFKSLIIAKKRTNKLNKNSLYKLQKNNEENNLVDTVFSQRSDSKKNNNIIINKSSETKQEIKIVPLGKKIDPLIIKKFVDKPKIKQIINKDGSVTDVIAQNKIVTSIESKPIINSENENIIKESVTKVYTTISKNLEKNENENNNMFINKNNDNNDNINKFNNKEENFLIKRNDRINMINDNENNSVFIRRDFKDKKENNCNLEVINKPNFEKNNYSFSNNIIINKNNNNEKNIEINDNSTIPKNSDYNSFGFNSSYSIDNKIMTKNEQINYIKYLYYNDINNFNSFFLKLNGEDRENIINYFNDGNIENKKIYRKLKDILKKNNNEEEISIIINDDSFEDNK